jgi:hypothetical protein
MSQVDFAPTLLGLLNWSYATRFYGWDVIKTPGPGRALIGNYQRLGLLRNQQITVLKPVRHSGQFAYDRVTHALTPQAEDRDLRDDTIAYYQTASHLYQTGGYAALTDEEHAAAKTRVESEAPPRQ